jgi:hypothetical protein
LTEHTRKKLGEVGKTVEIHERKLEERKYLGGHRVERTVGIWRGREKRRETFLVAFHDMF